MAFYGYARVSTLDQDLTIQRVALKAAGAVSFVPRRPAVPAATGEPSCRCCSTSCSPVTPWS